jgi:hypothetical protein
MDMLFAYPFSVQMIAALLAAVMVIFGAPAVPRAAPMCRRGSPSVVIANREMAALFETVRNEAAILAQFKGPRRPLTRR